MFACVDLDLELKRRSRLGLGRKAENEVRRMTRLLRFALSNPGKSTADRVDCWSDGFGRDLNEVDILGIMHGPFKEQLVDCGSASKCDFALKLWRRKKVAKSAGNNKVLLNLTRIRPWRLSTQAVR